MRIYIERDRESKREREGERNSIEDEREKIEMSLEFSILEV